MKKLAGPRTVMGTILLKKSDAISEGGGTLVLMQREKVSYTLYSSGRETWVRLFN